MPRGELRIPRLPDSQGTDPRKQEPIPPYWWDEPTVWSRLFHRLRGSRDGIINNNSIVFDVNKGNIYELAVEGSRRPREVSRCRIVKSAATSPLRSISDIGFACLFLPRIVATAQCVVPRVFTKVFCMYNSTTFVRHVVERSSAILVVIDILWLESSIIEILLFGSGERHRSTNSDLLRFLHNVISYVLHVRWIIFLSSSRDRIKLDIKASLFWCINLFSGVLTNLKKRIKILVIEACTNLNNYRI